MAIHVIDHARSFQLPQPSGEEAAREAGQAAGKIVEATRPGIQVADDHERPPFAEDIEGPREWAVLPIARARRHLALPSVGMLSIRCTN